VDSSKDREAPEQLEAIYANYFKLGHNVHEFLLDFGQMFAEDTEPEFLVRIVTNPVYAKIFWTLLSDSIEQYQKTHGPIPET